MSLLFQLEIFMFSWKRVQGWLLMQRQICIIENLIFILQVPRNVFTNSFSRIWKFRKKPKKSILTVFIVIKGFI